MHRLLGTVTLASACFALAAPARALSPIEAAALARDIARPVTSYVKLEDTARLFPGLSARPTRMFAPGGAPMGIYLNPFGGNYTCGDDDASRNISSVVCGSNAGNVGDFSLSAAAWSDVLTCVQDMFAPFNAYVTDVEPVAGEYVEAVVGGSPEDAGMPFGVGGVAPFTCGVVPGAVVYTFADVYGNDTQSICETTAQEVAHAFGLDHELLCEDPMTYLGGCGSKSFQDTYATCGEFEPRACSCDIPSQNSVQMMLERLGAFDGSPPPPPPDDNEDPTVALVSPADGAVLLANSTIVIEATVDDDTALSVVELEWDFTGETMFCPGDGGAWTCDRSGTSATWTIDVGEGARTFRVNVRDIVGNEATSADRTIYLTPDGVSPPDDQTPPTVLVLTPRDGAVLEANSPLEVIALVGDDAGLSRVELDWPYNGEVFACPSQIDGVSCNVDGDVYTWTLQVGQGDRTFRVRAVDFAGNVTRSEELVISLNRNAPVEPEDGNDVPADAVSVACGDELELTGTDADWFDVDAPAGDDVSVVVDGPGASVVATDEDGTGVLADGDGAVEFTSAGTTKVAVLPDAADGGAYTLRVECAEPAGARKARARDGGAVFACGASGGVPVPFAGLLVALALLGRRRR